MALTLYKYLEACTINAGHISEWFNPTRGLRQGGPESSKNLEACTINAGHISEGFNPTRGLRQGGPESSSYFILDVEVLGR